MNNRVRRIYVQKKDEFAVEAHALCRDLKENLSLNGLKRVDLINRYDICGITDEEYEQARSLILSEPPVDIAYDEELPQREGVRQFVIEYLPGQYDQRADSAEECISILTCKSRPTVRSARVILLEGSLSDEEFAKVKDYCINPVETREAAWDKPDTLDLETTVPEDVAVVEGFINMTSAELGAFMKDMGFAMDESDLEFCRGYFRDTEKRDPTVTELRMIDTYWSDHCRHTTFLTKINQVDIPDGDYSASIKGAYNQYINTKNELYPNGRDTSFMDIALAAMRKLKRDGKLTRLDESEEINACSIEVEADVDGKTEKWLVMFKNETHNHPTEIEPFGGAATCLGGAIRDPLSGRSYVYQAMRITGAGDPRKTLAETLPGKLMQRKITRGAAAGYSSYGNQIGLATGQVCEVYHEGYVAKRMELGAVIGATPKDNVVRERPEAGDLIVLLGGRTGRDGCGGATGSSKAHTDESIKTCGAEVQKGNPPVERKIQRLFRKGEVTRLIKRCNDFGAGGVSVAVGELADGLIINLDKVPKKYEGLDGTELAISESQERMAVVVDKADADKFIAYANEENLEATVVAEVTDKNRLTMYWRGKTVCDISRDFLNTNGVTKNADVSVVLPKAVDCPFGAAKQADNIEQEWLSTLSDLNVCSQKGLSERFDSTIGAATVVMPFGGKHQLTPAEGMAAKLPVAGETDTATVMTFGYNPNLSSWSPFHGAVYAVVESVSKAVAMGACHRDLYLTFQEFFERLGNDPKRWGKPFSALLGAFHAQMTLGIAAIGGKDSMSGSFNDLDVPPTLVSIAVNTVKASKVVTNHFKQANSKVVLVKVAKDADSLPDFAALHHNYDKIYQLIQKGSILAAGTIKSGGLCEAVSKMCFGNMLGFAFADTVTTADLFAPDFGAILLEVQDGAEICGLDCVEIGHTTSKNAMAIGNTAITLEQALDAWQKPLEKIFPSTEQSVDVNKTYTYEAPSVLVASAKIAKPRVFIPVFPGTNCEYDTARAFERAGAVADVLPFRNLTPDDTNATLAEMKKRIDLAQIVMIPGGFSGGDEPDGSGKYIATAFRNPYVSEAVSNLLGNRDGLMLGICNGFQALIKLGLVTHGQICDLAQDAPTLTFNTIGRHISTMVNTRIASNKSPWLAGVSVGDIHTIAMSHGEGRFYANAQWVQTLAKNGQIATQYVDFDGNASGDIRFNPNGSVEAIEGITSPDGRVLGKMGHSERFADGLFQNIEGNMDQKLFESGVKYYK